EPNAHCDRQHHNNHNIQGEIRMPGKCVRVRKGHLVVLAAVLLPVTCPAAIVENLTMGNAKALSLGNAVTADPPGLDSIHYNPAGLARLDGRQYNLKVLGA